MSFISLYTPLTDIAVVNIFYMNETTPRPTLYPFLQPPLRPFLEPTLQ
jgi:hypothetical protein